MYVEFLIEDASGKKMLEILVSKIVPHLDAAAYSIHQHKGISHLYKKLPLRLPSFASQYAYDKQAYIFIIHDLDDETLEAAQAKFDRILGKCRPKPRAAFCLAIEEMEAWLLGDQEAIKTVYPSLKANILAGYAQDSICGTWELLADAVYKGGAAALKKMNPGAEKCNWAEKITPHMDIDANQSPSFQYFRDKLRSVVNAAV